MQRLTHASFMVLWSSIFVTLVAKSFWIVAYRLLELSGHIKDASHRLRGLVLDMIRHPQYWVIKQSNLAVYRILCDARLIRSAIPVETVRADMIIFDICEFLYRTI